MAAARESAEWERASGIMALLYSVARLQCAKPPAALEPKDFNPYAAPEAPMSATELRALFGRKPKPKKC